MLVMLKRLTLAAVLSLSQPAFAFAFAQSGNNVTTTIRLVVPAATAGDSVVFLAGNLLSPAWRANGLRMQRLPGGEYSATLQLPVNATFEYKFTRGSWETVEKAPGGGDIPNRRFVVQAGSAITDTVRLWGVPTAARAGTAGAASSAISSGTLTGLFRSHPSFASQHLSNRRNVVVYLPPNYEGDSSARYPVLYMHDGQNIFDRSTGFGGQEWEVDETAQRLISEKKIEPLIIVAVYNTAARMSEYTPVGANPAPQRSGEDYTRFLVEELKPFIDSTYRTHPSRNNTAVAGSSLGGLISLAMVFSRPEVFGKAGVVSPSLFWNDGQMLKEAARVAPAGSLQGVKFWVDIGLREGSPSRGDSISSAVRNTRLLIYEFRKSGLVEGVDYFYLEVPDGQHNERSWAQRVDQMLMFLFPAGQWDF
jgi:predicted alpha/beta superfamily hydrolase